jgi:acyl-CoA thioester hydrolase
MLPSNQHETTIRVRYTDCDPMGVLHHSRYFTYFEIARTEFYRAIGGNHRSLEDAGQFVVVVKAECSFRRPARYDDVLTIHTKVLRITAVRIEHEYRVLRGEEVLAVGHITLAVVNREGQLIPVPEDMRTEAG